MDMERTIIITWRICGGGTYLDGLNVMFQSLFLIVIIYRYLKNWFVGNLFNMCWAKFLAEGAEGEHEVKEIRIQTFRNGHLTQTWTAQICPIHRIQTKVLTIYQTLQQSDKIQTILSTPLFSWCERFQFHKMTVEGNWLTHTYIKKSKKTWFVFNFTARLHKHTFLTLMRTTYFKKLYIT